jgi:hypothetical protein
MHIDKETYKIDSKNFNKTNTTKSQIILCGSLRKKNFGITRLKHKDFGNTKKWNTYTISREGVIYQHYDPKYYNDFIGIKEIDKQSISIVFENLGGLIKINENEYVNWVYESCSSANVLKKAWSNYMYWEKYTDAQINSSAELCKELCKKFKIRNKVIGFNSYHKDTYKFNGIVTRSNYFESATDLNPSFDFEEFQKNFEDEKEIKIIN